MRNILIFVMLLIISNQSLLYSCNPELNDYYAMKGCFMIDVDDNLNASTISNLTEQQMNNLFINFLNRIPKEYKHNEQDYLMAHQIIEQIKQSAAIRQQNLKDVILLLGKTGWGKSTVANLLEGVQFIVNEDGTFQPKNRSNLITDIGTGIGSTTLAPKLLQTRFGTVYDLPGDEQTRGIFMQMVNAITKMNIAKTSKSIKLLLTVPEQVLTAEGSYGSELKKYMEALDKFLGGINRFKNNIIFIVNFAKRRKNQLKIVQNNIRALLNHEDRQLQKYAQLFAIILDKKRIKIIAEPDWNVYKYSQPTQWTNQSFSSIIDQIKKLDSIQVSENEFNLPKNLALIQKLNSFMEILKQKIRHQFNKKFEHLNITGIELTTVKKILKDIRRSKNIGVKQFVKLFRKNDYFNTSQIYTVIQQIQFIHKFQADFGDQQNELKADWISSELDSKLTETLEQIQRMCTYELENFKKNVEGHMIAVRPNYQKYNEINAEYRKFQELTNYYDALLNEQSNESSIFYEELSEKILVEVRKQPVQIEQSYIEYTKEIKTRKVLKTQQATTPTKKYRQTFKEHEQFQIVSVPKIRKVPKTKQVVHEYQGERRWILFGPREKIIKITTIEYEAEQIEFEVINKTKKTYIPHTEQYEQYETKIIQIDESYIEDVPVQLKRKKTVWKQNQIFEVRTSRVFNTTKLKNEQIRVELSIRQQVSTIKSFIGQRQLKTPQQLMKQLEKYSESMLIRNNTMSDVAFNYLQVNFQWFMQVLEYFSKANPTKQLEGLANSQNTEKQ